MALVHKYTLICEDIRQENTGKWMVIGLYPASIVTSQLPFHQPSLAFFISFTAEEAGQFKFKFQFSHFDSSALMVPEMTGVLGVPKAGPVVLPIKLNGLQFRAHGIYAVSVEIEGQGDPALTEFLIEIGQPPAMRPPTPRQ